MENRVKPEAPADPPRPTTYEERLRQQRAAAKAKLEKPATPAPAPNEEAQDAFYEEYYDEIIIPDIGRPHPKVAITLRNQWMVDAADLVIAYVENSSGGAYKAMAYAEKTGKPVINLATDCEEEIWT